MLKKTKKYRRIATWIGFMSFLIWYAMCLPKQLFHNPTSLVLVDNNKELLGAHVARDGQWRFPQTHSVNPKFCEALVVFEDKRFYNHIGVDIMALARAVKLNATQGKVVSGGSTLSMQVIRMSRKNPKRTYFEKIGEIFRATRLEMRYTKQEILNMYASHAPFGGNVVGIDAASWKYFGKNQSKLSWAEAAMLAVLPNAPSLIHLGKNREQLLSKRNNLLDKLLEASKIDELEYQLAKLEPLPHKPLPLPNLAAHLKSHYLVNQQHQHIQTTIKAGLQQKVMDIVNQHTDKKLKPLAIYNASAVVVEVKTGNVLAYVGNTKDKDNIYENEVDMIRAKRSTGSILKPLLYSSMLSNGDILPHTLVQDIPVEYYGYSPQNFNLTYDGVVPAHDIVVRSLNIPSVNMLQQYGVNKFLTQLQGYGFKSVDKEASHYGLSLILGGAEVTSFELAKAYTHLSQKLAGEQLSFKVSHHQATKISDVFPDKTAIYYMMEAMSELSRPGEDNAWQVFNNSRKIAWKTGTSFGGRDAWAVGCTPNYVVVTWAGNADGEGRPSLTGSTCAAPILFDIFDQLPAQNHWFSFPDTHAIQTRVCKQSGCLANQFCEETKELNISPKGKFSKACTYCRNVALDSTKQWTVEGTNYPPFDRVMQPYFLLNPMEAFYYQKKNANYKTLPPVLTLSGDFSIIYPEKNAKIYLPKIDSSTHSSTVFKASVQEKHDKLFWMIDDEFIAETVHQHQIVVSLAKGKHLLMVTNKKGVKVRVPFEITD